MDLVSLFRILIRRWLVLVPMVLLTVACAVILATSIRPDYESSAVILLIGRVDTSAGSEDNPLEDLRPLNITAQALAIIMSDPSVRNDLADQGFLANYQVSVRPETPILSITARTDNRATAVASRDSLVELLRSSLENQQRIIRAPETSFITAQTISSSAGARPINAARDRTLVGVLALGLAASIAAAVAVEHVLSNRAEGRRLAAEGRLRDAASTNAMPASEPETWDLDFDLLVGDTRSDRTPPDDDLDPLVDDVDGFEEPIDSVDRTPSEQSLPSDSEAVIAREP